MKKLIENRFLRTALLVTGAGLLGAWVAPRVGAAPLRTDGPHLSFAGTLRQNGAPITTQQVVTFTFKKNGVAVCNPGDMTVTPDAEGQFTAVIALITCPAGIFDGKAAVFLDISIGGNLAVADQLVTYAPLAVYADHAGYPDCPLGYNRDGSITTSIVCRQGVDEVVKVGTKSAAFWVDRYEASVWEFADGTGKAYGNGVSDFPFPVTGQFGADNTKGFALSKVGVLPATTITWFQADLACRASGKRLPTNAEWTIAARGTPDPGDSPGDGGKCRTSGNSMRPSGQGTACVSQWGAEDMIGNTPEIISEWAAA
ncbi:MAG: SUMF1/EgtB/PvdO family nonheme iron enzyme, partial [Polyangiaceae bacterium]